MRGSHPRPGSRSRDTFRVLHVVSACSFAGIERHVVQLTRELRVLGCVADLACPPRAHQLRAEATAAGVPLLPSGSCRPRAWMAALGREMIADPPDAIHVHDGRSAVACALLSLTGRGQLFRTQHFARPASVERDGWTGRASLALHRTVNGRLDGYIAVSECVADGGLERGETGTSEVIVIPPAIVLPSDEAVSRARRTRARLRDPVVAFAGRLEAERRLDVLLLAIPMVRKELPECHFVLAGSGAAETDLHGLADDLGVADAITWTGWLAEPYSVLERAHVYVNPWPWEGFGMAMAEAMALAMPVIAVDSGASSEMVDPGKTGLLVAANDPAALAAATIEVLSDRERAAAMGEAARRRATSLYGAARTAQATLDFYLRLRERAAA